MKCVLGGHNLLHDNTQILPPMKQTESPLCCNTPQMEGTPDVSEEHKPSIIRAQQKANLEPSRSSRQVQVNLEAAWLLQDHTLQSPLQEPRTQNVTPCVPLAAKGANMA
jgi:hypothetical protein